MEKLSESDLKSAILVYLIEYQGEEVSVEDLVKDLFDFGFFKAFTNKMLSDLFIE